MPLHSRSRSSHSAAPAKNAAGEPSASGSSPVPAAADLPRSAAGREGGMAPMAAAGSGSGAVKAGAATPGNGCSSLWFATNPSKRWGEAFFMIYTPFWLTICLGIVVPYKLYERFTELEYLLLGLISAVPSFLLPLLFVGKADMGKCWKDRYWVKANLWIIIFSYVGNYFWTHYFFTVLGASYTFPSWKMNDVPHTTLLLTHVCFLFYHVASNLTLRRLRHSVADLPQTIRVASEVAWVLVLAYFIAYLETLAISNFPYYQFVDRGSMYKVGSLFYAIYFIVSFPMFLRVDEKPGDPWDLGRVAVDALGAAMLVTIILDLWRLFLGPIVPAPDSKQCPQSGLAWFR
uniref:Cycloeucalenol cycloisomerase n=1 Tax=Anthurium amnicola TaxID=1678845 RepID=A0A1D1YJS6_9ARAE